jgi:ferredoxin
VEVADSDFTVECSTVISAIGQAVDNALAAGEGLRVTSRGIAADEGTLATNLPGVFAGGDAVLGADLAVRAVAAGRIAAASIHRYLSGQAVTGEPAVAGIALRPLDDAELAAIFRAVEKGLRPSGNLTALDAIREARRCLTCGCRKADCCRVRSLATEYQVDAYRFSGARRRFSQDLSHPEVIYEPGKCVNCEACVRVAEAAGEELGLATIGRGFEVRVAPPFGATLAEALRKTARQCADACPTGALALRTARSCDLCSLARAD